MSYEYFLEIYWPSVDASGWPSVRFSTPISDTQAIVIGLANGEGATVQVLDNKLYYSGFIFKR